MTLSMSPPKPYSPRGLMRGLLVKRQRRAVPEEVVVLKLGLTKCTNFCEHTFGCEEVQFGDCIEGLPLMRDILK